MGHLEQGDAEGPDVRGDGVGLARDALGCHVVGGTDEGVGVAFRAELAADAEVAEADLARAGKEDVGGFDVWVDVSGYFEGWELDGIPLCIILRPWR